VQIPSRYKFQVLSLTLKGIFSQHSSSDLPFDLCEEYYSEKVASLSPKMIDNSTKIEFFQASFKTSTLKHRRSPAFNKLPIHRHIRKRTISHELQPNPLAETTTKEKMFPTFLFPITEEA
jgi:hypothetical protein